MVAYKYEIIPSYYGLHGLGGNGCRRSICYGLHDRGGNGCRRSMEIPHDPGGIVFFFSLKKLPIYGNLRISAPKSA